MKRSATIKVFLRSFFIHCALNFRRMQNLGFTYSLIPLLHEKKMSDDDRENFLGRHLQMFNTHPYFSAFLIAAIARMEEDRPDGADASYIEVVKNSLAGPYAAIGDTFFWGAMRPCAGIVASWSALLGVAWAPLIFLVVYTPAHVWVRLKGFIEGYRQGKQGVGFVRKMALPTWAIRVRWLSVALLAGFAAWLLSEVSASDEGLIHLLFVVAGLLIILSCRFLLRRGVSQIFILYGGVLLLVFISSQGWYTWWK